MPDPKSTREDGKSYEFTGMTKLVTRAAKGRESGSEASSVQNTDRPKVGDGKARRKERQDATPRGQALLLFSPPVAVEISAVGCQGPLLR
jgi:hypothetical protein